MSTPESGQAPTICWFPVGSNGVCTRPNHRHDVGVEPETPGVAAQPETVAEAITLLNRVADARSEYTPDHDVSLSIHMLREAAHIIANGDVRSWVPSWRWQDFA